MSRKTSTVALTRHYLIADVKAARSLAHVWIRQAHLEHVVAFGLPEIDDRYHVWRVPVLNKATQARLGEIVIDARTGFIQRDKSTTVDVLQARLLGANDREPITITEVAPPKRTAAVAYRLSTLPNTIALGDCEAVMQTLPEGSVDLVFTSPPYYNARLEYADYRDYADYLEKMRRVIRQAHRVLNEGRFFVMNIAPVLIRRASRSEASQRLAVPFDMHRLFTLEGYDFIDDIIWEKPEGAGWVAGRGRRFAADRNPLQYKAVPVTEYVLVYRKHTDRLIDWNIRAHPSPELVKESAIGDDYEHTNIWRLAPAHDKRHPAIFPVELAERVIRYYSFKNDVVLDPFGGIGTTGRAAAGLDRRFVLIEQKPKYVDIMRAEAEAWTSRKRQPLAAIMTAPVDQVVLPLF